MKHESADELQPVVERVLAAAKHGRFTRILPVEAAQRGVLTACA